MYKRLTIKDEEYGNYVDNKGSELSKPKVAVSFNGKIHGAVIDRLAELEDRIESGTLIEIDHSLIGQGIIGIHHYTDGTYQLDLDENIVIGFAIDGVITWNGTHQFNDEFRNGMFFIDNEKGRTEAEAKLRELKENNNE